MNAQQDNVGWSERVAGSGYKCKENTGVEGWPAVVKGAAKLAPVLCGLCVELEGLVAQMWL
jgi:hypothetical protein